MAEERATQIQSEKPQFADKYLANYGAHREGMKPAEVAEYYSTWGEKYEETLTLASTDMAEERATQIQSEKPHFADKYLANYGAHREGMKPAEVAEYYSKWGQKYEEDLAPGVYNGPSILAKELSELYPEERDTLKILDIGAGTGFLGEQLYQLGFRQLDALDPAKELLLLSERKNIYKRLMCEFMSDKKLPVEDNAYDCVAVAGAMGEGHIPCAALHEMARIVKQGGYVVIVMRAEYLDYVAEYRGRLEKLMANMETSGAWERVSRKSVKNYSFNNDGVVFVFRVL